MGARVLHEPRRGYGRACLTGLTNASTPDVVVFLDGDYSDRPAELPLLLAPIIEGRADITLGSRLGKQSISGALPWHQTLGNRLAAFLIRFLYGLKISDLGPFRAARADVLRQLELEETTYGWAVEMILKGTLARIPHRRGAGELLSADWEIEDQRYAEGHGRSGVVHSLLDSALLFSAAQGRDATAGVNLAQQSSMESFSENPAHSPNMSRTLVVMAKAPRPGMVKTRLAQSLPVEAVTDLYRCLLEDTMTLARSLGTSSGASFGTVDVAIMCPASDVEELKRLAQVEDVARVVAQKGEGLAAGLTSVFAQFAAPGREGVVAFNSDSPHLPASVLESAFETLTRTTWLLDRQRTAATIS